MNIIKSFAMIAALTMSGNFAHAQMIGKNDIKLASDRMTPEALWAMGRISAAAPSPDGKPLPTASKWCIRWAITASRKTKVTRYFMSWMLTARTSGSLPPAPRAKPMLHG